MKKVMLALAVVGLLAMAVAVRPTAPDAKPFQGIIHTDAAHFYAGEPPMHRWQTAPVGEDQAIASIGARRVEGIKIGEEQAVRYAARRVEGIAIGQDEAIKYASRQPITVQGKARLGMITHTME